jgi:hypothetical protein
MTGIRFQGESGRLRAAPLLQMLGKKPMRPYVVSLYTLTNQRKKGGEKNLENN